MQQLDLYDCILTDWPAHVWRSADTASLAIHISSTPLPRRPHMDHQLATLCATNGPCLTLSGADTSLEDPIYHQEILQGNKAQ
jgi:hypothetical protein